MSPKVPQEDPALKAQRLAAAERAEQERIRAIQEQLTMETQQRSGRFGLRSLLGEFRPTGGRASVLGAG